jgi:hypothetical protein
MTKLEAVTEMEQSAFTGNWDKFRSFLAPDIAYRCGNTADFRGSEGVVNFMKELLSSRLALNDLQVRSAYETDDAVIIEFNMKAVRVGDNKNVDFPCLDIYRFGSDGKIHDWRVHAIETTLVV